jgi:hypothetical protein
MEFKDTRGMNGRQNVSRRTFLEVTAGMFAAASAASGARPNGNAAAVSSALREFETPLCTLRLDPVTGDLCGIRWKDPDVELIGEPRLGENFRLLLPRPGDEANYFLSRQQKVSRMEARADGVACHYDSLRNDREEVPVKVHYEIKVVEGNLEFAIEVENATDLPLAEVFFAIVGGQHGFGNRQDMESLVPGWNANLARSAFTDFHAGGYGGGNLGIRYDAEGFTYPGGMQMGWMEFCNRQTNVGLYYGNHDAEPRLAALYYELRPFTKSAGVTKDNWPTPADVPPGEPIGLTMGWLKFPYLRRGRFNSGPVALRVHAGDWHEGSQFYRAWFDRHFPVKRPRTWLRQEMAWQSIIISNCEDAIVWKFKDLPKLAADAKKYGVTTFEILGWDMGGIDRGYPQYRPNPRLGTHEEFRQALAAIKKLGVHPVIFANLDMADTATPLYQEKLHNYIVMHRWAADNAAFGWGEGTIGARMGLARSNMTVISPAHPEVRQVHLEQFVALVQDGAEAFQLDKTGGGGTLDFNPRLPVSPDRSMVEGILTMLRETLEKAHAINPDFALASETCWDRTFPWVDVSYVRMNDIDMPTPALKYTFPEWTSTICAESPGDIGIMNNGMRYGLVWAVQPRHYNDSMDEPLTRPLSRYVQELIRIRAKHKDVLFFGRFRDTRGAEVNAGPSVRYSVFEGMDKPGKACVVVNFSDGEETAEVTWPGGQGSEVEVLAPFQPDRVQTLPVKVVLAPRTCAVIARK